MTPVGTLTLALALVVAGTTLAAVALVADSVPHGLQALGIVAGFLIASGAVPVTKGNDR